MNRNRGRGELAPLSNAQLAGDVCWWVGVVVTIFAAAMDAREPDPAFSSFVGTPWNGTWALAFGAMLAAVTAAVVETRSRRGFLERSLYPIAAGIGAILVYGSCRGWGGLDLATPVVAAIVIAGLAVRETAARWIRSRSRRR